MTLRPRAHAANDNNGLEDGHGHLRRNDNAYDLDDYDDECCAFGVCPWERRYRKRRFLGFPLFFWLCCSCCVVVIAIVAFSLGLASFLRIPAPVPAPVGCNYSEWSQFSFICYTLDNGSFVQLRNKFSFPGSSGCPDLLDGQECNPQAERGLLLDTKINTAVTCFYDDVTTLCNGSLSSETTKWFGTTNTTDLVYYYANAPFVEDFTADLVPQFPCDPNCPNSSGLPPVHADCTYGAWTAWSSTCLEYPPGNFSVARQAIADPYFADCPSLVDRQACYVNASGAGSCSSQYTTFNDSATIVECTYNLTTGYCTNWSLGYVDYTWCNNNASDIDDFFARTDPYILVGEVLTGNAPCTPECAIINISDIIPSPIVSSPTPTPSATCNYTPWATWGFDGWSYSCYELSPGVYQQARVRYSDPYYPFCTDTIEYQDCNVSTCLSYDVTEDVVECTYNSSNFCNGSIINETMIRYCITNSSNYALYIATAPSENDGGSIISGLPCDTSCPLVDPNAPCIYDEWSIWGTACDEIAPSTFRQNATRSAISVSLSCTDTIKFQTCNVSTCTTFNRTSVVLEACNYDPTTTLCSNSTAVTNTLTACITNTSDYATYFGSQNWPVTFFYTFGITPCLLECPATSGELPVPPPTPPPPPPCLYSAFGLWSFECFEYPVGVYFQLRNKTLIVDNPECAPAIIARRPCGLPANCATYQYRNTSTSCYYNSSSLCANSSRTNITSSYCTTNATNLTQYETTPHLGIVIETLESDIEPCLAICPGSGTGIETISNNTGVLNLTIQFTCFPPYYNNGSGCVLCTNTTVCGTATLDPANNLCTQTPCQATDPCTSAVCDETTGICNIYNSAYNGYNSSVRWSCDPATGHVTYTPTPGNSSITFVANCDDHNASTIDSFNNITQKCDHIASPPPDMSPVPNISDCIAAALVIPNNSNTNVSGTVDNYYVCANKSQYCVNGTCIAQGTATPSYCKYQRLVCGISDCGIFGHCCLFPDIKTYYDDSRCVATIPGAPAAICDPIFCPWTRSGCMQCEGLSKQLDTLIPVNCFCCDPAHGNADCVPGSFCGATTGLCSPPI